MAPVLKILRDHSAELELRLPSIEAECTGRVLDVLPDGFLLENIRPRDVLSQLRRGIRFSFAARLDGLYLCGEDCSITGVESERGLPYYRATLPERLLRQQRRRHTRITLPPRVSPDEGLIHIDRANGDEAVLQGQIIDVSVGGCRAVFNGAVVPTLETDERLPQCRLQVTSTLTFTASGVVRHNAWDAKQRNTTCGIEFTEMSVTDRRRLEHYIQQVSSRNAFHKS